MANPSQIPARALTRQLSALDQDTLIQRYRLETNLVNRRALTVALGFIGDEKVVELFKHTLTEEFKGRQLKSGTADLTANEESVMSATVLMLGLLAAKYDSAFEWLKAGVDPSFWPTNALWTTEGGPDEYGILAGRCMVALAWSGRPQVADLLVELKQQPLINTTDPREWRRSMKGALSDAAFWYDLAHQRGVDYVKDLYGAGQSSELFREWIRTENGKAWYEWAR